MSELDALVNERSAAYREKYSFENQLMAVGDKIQRLQYAVKQVDGVKDGLVAMSTRTINLATVENWKGNKFTEYQTEISELSSAILSYGLEVDRIHDDMNLELARLQNEESNLQGLHGTFRSRVEASWNCRDRYIQGVMGMGGIDNTRKAFLLMMSTVMLASSGCGSGEVGKSKAEKIVIQNLEEKYGGDFEIRSVESKNLGSDIFRDHIYEMTVFSSAMQEEFTVKIFRDGTNMADNYENLFYEDQVRNELNDISMNEEGWQLVSFETDYSFYQNQQKSDDFEEYKRAEDKLVIEIAIKVNDMDNERLGESIFNYINELQSLGYRISADIQYKDRVETITVLDHGAAAEIEDVIKALDNLEK